jgi:hypothetical protein
MRQWNTSHQTVEHITSDSGTSHQTVEHITSDSGTHHIRQWNTSHQHANYWQKNNVYRDMTVGALNCILGLKLDNKPRYDHVPNSVETSHEGKFTVLWKQQCKRTELLLTINRTS